MPDAFKYSGEASCIHHLNDKLFMKYFLMSLLTLLALFVVAQEEIDISDVANHVGDSVKICTKI